MSRSSVLSMTLLNALSSWLGTGSAVRSEKAFQETLLTVQELQHLSADIERGTFTKNQLSTVIRKMLLIEDLE